MPVSEAAEPQPKPVNEAGVLGPQLSVGEILGAGARQGTSRKEKRAMSTHFGLSNDTLMTREQAIKAMMGYVADTTGQTGEAARALAEKLVDAKFNKQAGEGER